MYYTISYIYIPVAKYAFYHASYPFILRIGNILFLFGYLCRRFKINGLPSKTTQPNMYHECKQHMQCKHTDFIY